MNPKSVVQEWIFNLSLMQQTTLLTSIRNEDGIDKGHPQKDLIRWFRRCVLLSAYDGKVLDNPHAGGGGSFAGTVHNIDKAADDFLRSRDSMSLHYYGHSMHSFQILGYNHPTPWIRDFWLEVYNRMVNAMHVFPESKLLLDKRLGDCPEDHKAREDLAGGCST